MPRSTIVSTVLGIAIWSFADCRVCSAADGSAVYQAALPAVVKIYVYGIDRVKSGRGKSKTALTVYGGSGFLINEFGNVITNAHVIQSAVSPNWIRIRFEDGMEYECARVVFVDNDRDLAILELPPNHHEQYLPLLPTGDARMLEQVYAIGCPGNFNFSCEPGSVTLLNPFLWAPHLFMTNASLTHGNSGGPVLNESGQVIGVVVSGLESTLGSDRKSIKKMGEKNFAIRVSVLRQILEDQDITFHVQSLVYGAPPGSMNQSTATRTAENGLLGTSDQLLADSLVSRNHKEAQLHVQDSIHHVRVADSIRFARREDSLKSISRADSTRLAMKLEDEQIARAAERRRRAIEDSIHDVDRGREHDARLPMHLECKVFGGGGFYGGRIADNPQFFNSTLSYWTGELGLFYRFDASTREERGQLVGLFATFGLPSLQSISTMLVEQNHAQWSGPSLETHGLYEAEAGFVFGEWFRLTAGIGQQFFASAVGPNKLTYFVSTGGFIVRFGTFEVAAMTSVLFGGDYTYAAGRYSLVAGLHFPFMQW